MLKYRHLLWFVLDERTKSGELTCVFTKNKKVLLRERKRHTDRGVSSTTRWGTPLPRVGVPPTRSDGGYLRWGTPRHGTPNQTWLGYPHLDLAGVPPPHLDLAGVPPTWTWLGYPHHLDLAGVPPCLDLARVCPPYVWQTESSPDRHVLKHNLPSYYVHGR